jgi:hypothetical protein
MKVTQEQINLIANLACSASDGLNLLMTTYRVSYLNKGESKYSSLPDFESKDEAIKAAIKLLSDKENWFIQRIDTEFLQVYSKLQHQFRVTGL